MEARKADRFDALIKLCQPTSSQEAELENCPFDGNVDSDQDLSSTPPTPSEPTEIFMLSVSESGSVEQCIHQDDDELEFQTPPEQHARSSSEDQNVEAGEHTAADIGDSLRTVDLSEDTLVVGENELTKNKVIEEELDNDSVIEKKGVSEEDVDLEWDGETMPIGETELVVIEVEVDKNVSCNNLETEEIGEELSAVNLGDYLPEKMCRGGDIVAGRGCEAQKKGESNGPTEELEVTGVSDEVVRLSNYVENIEAKEFLKRGEDDCKVLQVTEGERVSKEGIFNLEVCTNAEGTEQFEDFIGRKRKRKKRSSGARFVGGRRELPISLRGQGKNIGDGEFVEKVGMNTGAGEVSENVGMKNRFFNDILEVLKPVFSNVDGDSEDVDFLEIAKRRGLTFPQPRWWSP